MTYNDDDSLFGGHIDTVKWSVLGRVAGAVGAQNWRAFSFFMFVVARDACAFVRNS